MKTIIARIIILNLVLTLKNVAYGISERPNVTPIKMSIATCCEENIASVIGAEECVDVATKKKISCAEIIECRKGQNFVVGTLACMNVLYDYNVSYEVLVSCNKSKSWPATRISCLIAAGELKSKDVDECPDNTEECLERRKY